MNDDRVMDLLHDAVADVEPRHGVREIRTRTRAARSPGAPAARSRPPR